MKVNTKKKESPVRLGKNDSFVRTRVNALLAQAVKKPLTIVCAGMGCGKTQAVYDFSQECGMPVAWVRLSDTDNDQAHFWKSFVQAIAQADKSLSDEYNKLGFPSSEKKMGQFFDSQGREAPGSRYLLVADNFHHINNPAILYFFEQSINNLTENRSLVIISREYPQINISSLMIRDNASIIGEGELNFTEGELYHYLIHQGLAAETSSLSKFFEDSKGWAFIINFIARLLKKTPGYAGYVQGAIKKEIYQLIEAEIWNTISVRLRQLLLSISLTGHRSAGLVSILAQGDIKLISELMLQNAFVRFESHMDLYYIQPLFMDFLQTRQGALSDNEKRGAYRAIADWCVKNDYALDALLYYEKLADYETIVSLLFESPMRFLIDNAEKLLGIFDRIGESVYDNVDLSAAMHVQAVMNSGDLQKAGGLLQSYEAKYLDLPEGGAFRNRMLGCLYYQWAVFRLLHCTVDDCYDFDVYFTKACSYLKKDPVKPGGSWYRHPSGMWTCLAGGGEAGSTQEFLNALVRSQRQIRKAIKGLGEGLDDLCQGEQHFYQAHISKAQLYTTKALEKARDFGQFGIIWRALFYDLRIAVFQGEYPRVELVLDDIEAQMQNNGDPDRFLTYDIIRGWYNHVLCQPEHTPYWLKGKFTDCPHYANTLENYGNHLKAMYYYMTESFEEALEYINEKKQQRIVLYEKIELLAMEACIRFKMKDAGTAVGVLWEAYESAYRNGVVMPFIELGKDMRALASAAASYDGCKVPPAWLKSIKQKSSSYSKSRARIIAEFKKTSEFDNKIVLSPREIEILQNLSNGLSRAEIAAKYDISVNTIKVHINNIYEKLNARNRAELFRIAVEQNLLK